MTGNRATLVDIGEAVLVCEARMTVTDVIPQEIGAVITVFWVTGGRTPRTLINILCTILTLPLCKSQHKLKVCTLNAHCKLLFISI